MRRLLTSISLTFLVFSVFGIQTDSLLKKITSPGWSFDPAITQAILLLREHRHELPNDSVRFRVDMIHAMRLYYVGEVRLAQDEMLRVCEMAKPYPDIMHKCFLYLAALPGTTKKRLEYVQMATSYNRLLSDSADIWLALGDIYKESDNSVLAESYFLKAMDLYRKLKMPYEMATCFNNLGTLYAMKASYKQARNAFEKCLEFALEAEAKNLQMSSFINLGQIRDIEGDAHGAFAYLRKAEQIAIEGGLVSNLYSVYLSMGIAFAQINRYDSAYEYAIKSDIMKDSMFSIQRMQGYALAEERFKTAERKQKIAELEVAEQAQRQAVSDRENHIRFILTISVILLIVCGLLIALVMSLKRRNIILKELAERNTELYLKKINEIVKESELKTVNAVLEGQEIERRRIAADLHDRLGSVLSTIKMHFVDIEKRLNQIETESALRMSEGTKLLDEAVQEVRRISHDLSSGVLAGFGLSAAISDLAENLRQTRQISVVEDLHLGIGRMSHGVEINVYRILQELVTNTLRHANASKIQIQAIRHHDHLSFVFEDNGKGMDTSAQNCGMGWQNIRNRIEHLNGKIEIDSRPGRGTIVGIEIPLIHS